MVVLTEFRTDDIERSQRFASWCDLTSDTLVPKGCPVNDLRVASGMVDHGEAR
jgi:hypothetical protein